VAQCVGFKGLPQRSVLSPFSYSFYTSQADRVFPIRCSMQYAYDLAVLEIVQRIVQSACAGLDEFFRDIQLSIFESKSQLVLLSRKHNNPSVYVTMHPCCAQISVPRCDVRQKTCTQFSRNVTND
jgi:hypothetical protein